MGTVLRFKPSSRKAAPPTGGRAGRPGEIVIFPGVRIERHDLDLGHRVSDSPGRLDFGGSGGGHRPRRTS